MSGAAQMTMWGCAWRRLTIVAAAACVGLLLRPAAIAGAEPAPSREVGVLGNRSGLFTSQTLPSLPGVNYHTLQSEQVTQTELTKDDTLSLLEICQVQPALQPAQLNAIVDWMTAGGKLLIADADRCTPGVNYDWLPHSFSTDNPGAQGNHNGRLDIVADTPLGSRDSQSSQLIDAAAYARDADSGDANVMVTRDPAYCATAVATNLRGKRGAVQAYAQEGRGLIVYNGLDLDQATSEPNLKRLWELELQLPWDRADGDLPSNLPVAPDCPTLVASLKARLYSV
jgi:hypothetical protein